MTRYPNEGGDFSGLPHGTPPEPDRRWNWRNIFFYPDKGPEANKELDDKIRRFNRRWLIVGGIVVILLLADIYQYSHRPAICYLTGCHFNWLFGWLIGWQPGGGS
jgi:hypothetical protein